MDFGNTGSTRRCSSEGSGGGEDIRASPGGNTLGLYKSVVESNRWNNHQALIALKGALIGGIGDRALEAYNEKGHKTLQSLLDCAEWALNKVGKHDPRADFSQVSPEEGRTLSSVWLCYPGTGSQKCTRAVGQIHQSLYRK